MHIFSNCWVPGRFYAAKTNTPKQIFFAMIAANGVKENIHSTGLISGLVVAADFFVAKNIS